MPPPLCPISKWAISCFSGGANLAMSKFKQAMVPFHKPIERKNRVRKSAPRCPLTRGHTVPEQESNIGKKMTTKETWTFYLRRLLLFARLSYYFIPCLRLTKSSTLLLIRFPVSTQQVSIWSLKMLLIYFFQKGHFWNGVCSFCCL